MISYQLTGYGQPLERAQTDRPDPVGTEVLVQIEACGVCHSDLHLRDGFFNMGDGKRLDLSRGRELPLTLGHEIAGTVVGLGPDAGGVESRRAPGGLSVDRLWQLSHLPGGAGAPMRGVPGARGVASRRL